jgi:hypothetical protein
MGGYITLRAMVIREDIKAGVIWGGVVASYPDMISRWRATPPATISAGARGWRASFIEQYGTFEENPEFWASISANSYLADLSGPLQLDHGEADETVPVDRQLLVWLNQDEAGVFCAQSRRERRNHARDDSIDEADVLGDERVQADGQVRQDKVSEDIGCTVEVLTQDEVEGFRIADLGATGDACSNDGCDVPQDARADSSRADMGDRKRLRYGGQVRVAV